MESGTTGDLGQTYVINGWSPDKVLVVASALSLLVYALLLLWVCDGDFWPSSPATTG